jgi:ATP-binding cassette subfamily B protein
MRAGTGFGGVRRLAAIVRSAFGLVWTTDRRGFLTILVFQVVNGVALGAELLVGRRLLESLGSTSSQRVRGSLSDIVPELVALGVLALVIAMSAALTEARSWILSEEVSRRVQREVLSVTTAVPVATFDDPLFHDHVRRSVDDSTHRPWQMVNGLVGIVGGLAGLISVMAVLLSIEPLLAALALVSYVPVWVVSRRNSREQFRSQVDLTAVERERWYLVDLMTRRDAASELRTLDANRHFLDRHEQVNERVLDRLKRVARARLHRNALATGGSVVIVLVAMLLAIDAAYNDSLTVANAVIVVFGVQQLGTRLRVLGGAIGLVYECSLFLDDLHAFLELAPQVAVAETIDDEARSAARRAAEGPVQARGLTFTYPGTESPVIRDIDVAVEPGEIVAFVGENGSGKTTLAKLLAGLYEPTSGCVTWGGIDVHSFPEPARRGHVALVFQDFLRLHYSIEENITLGDVRLHDAKRAMWAARRSGADVFLPNLERGITTRLGREFEDGVELSTGQWQRLALARTLYGSSPLVIFDEPTAALDPRNEARFFDQFRSMVEGRTAVVISHRMVSARIADSVYVIHHGRVAECGTHEQLMAKDGLYTAMVRAQSGTDPNSSITAEQPP